MKKKSSPILSLKKKHPTRLAGLRFKKEANSLRIIAQNLSWSSRNESIGNKLKMRRTISALVRHADILDGRA